MQRIQTPHSTIRHLHWTGLMISLSFCFPSLAFAAITTDGTVGLATNLAGPSYAIPASLGSQVGGNLFHSFSVFNINTGESATFSGPNNVSNIIARVTGGSLSTINGGLNSTIPLANLILVNPSGILFGPNASLDVGGSFYASTANYVRLADGGKFDATTPANSVLTTAPLAAFGFLGPVAPISVQGANLAVAEGKTLSLIGGDVDVTGGLKALGGAVNIASVASAGVVGLASGLDVSGFASLGAIFLDAPIDVSAGVISGTGTTEHAGSIYIQGGQITAGAATKLTAYTSNLAGGNIDIRATDTLTMNQSLVSTDAKGAGHGGSINLNAASMVLDNTAVYADTWDAGNAGSVTVGASRLDILNGSWISSDALTYSTGNGGSVNVTATGNMTLADGKVTTTANGSGHGGSVSLNAGVMTLVNAQVYADTWDAGNAGNVTVTANQLDILNGTWISSDALTNSTGNGGSVNVTVTGDMVVANGWITTVAKGVGLGGSIDIHAGGSILLGAGAKIQSDSTWDGDAGSIFITTPELNVDGGTISSTTADWGKGGNININVDKLILVNSGTIDVTTSSPYTRGTGGDINIEATTSIDLSGGAQIKSDSKGNGNAGSINLNAASVILDSATIFADTYGAGNAGNVTISANQLDILNGSWISSDALMNSTGYGGNVNVSVTGDMTIANNGRITTTADGEGIGGYIDITVDKLILASGGKIDGNTSSTNLYGWGGTITINATTSVALSGGAQISSDTSGNASADVIKISTPELNIDGGTISSTASGWGNGGWIDIGVDKLILANGGKIDASSSGSGAAGNIAINAATSIALSNGAQISSKSTSSGFAGTIDINAGGVFSSENSRVTTEAKQSDGGNISLVATDLIYLNYGEITATVGGGAGNGGSIFIDPLFVVLNNSNIRANAFGGNGGRINMVASNFFRSANSTITATSTLGLPGTVSLSTQLTDLSGSLADLPMVYLDATGLIKQRCAAQLEGNISTFVTSGRGGIPHEPGNLMPSASLLANVSGPQAGAGGMQYAMLSGLGCAN